MGLKPGYLVTKQVRLVRLLKRGGMGSVWVADHLGLKSRVAVKFMSGKVAEDASMVTRFAREATSAAQIKSPHVVQVHDHGVTEDGEPYIVMELLEGEDLGALLKRQRTLSLDQVGVIVAQICRVLRKAHQLGIVHRDIKPSNIFVANAQDEEMFVKLLDFGVAKLDSDNSDITTTGATVGTMVYMAPEQLLSARTVDFRADLWSVGVVVYRAITGELPFRNDDGVGALVRALDLVVFRPASEVVEGLPPDVDGWFARVFQRDPAARFASARELADEFMIAIGRGAPDSQVSTSTSSALRRQPRHRSEGPTLSASEPVDPGRARVRDSLNAGSESTIVDGEPPAERHAQRRGGDAVQAETLAGTATLTDLGRPRGLGRHVLGAALGLSIVGATVAVTYFVAPQVFRRQRPQAPVAASSVDAAPTASAASAAPAPALPPPAVAASATAATPPVDSSPAASTSASAASSAKPASRAGAIPGRGRPRQEKDYGF